MSHIVKRFEGRHVAEGNDPKIKQEHSSIGSGKPEPGIAAISARSFVCKDRGLRNFCGPAWSFSLLGKANQSRSKALL